MTVGGWILLIGSQTFVWGLAAWCYWKLLRGLKTPNGGATIMTE